VDRHDRELEFRVFARPPFECFGVSGANEHGAARRAGQRAKNAETGAGLGAPIGTAFIPDNKDFWTL
jgi:hypothetical protein